MAGATISSAPQLGELILEKLPHNQYQGMLVSDLLPHFPDKDRIVIGKVLKRLYKARVVDRMKINRGMSHACWAYWKI
jgi:hypothetical protein